ncbi:MAG: FtsQ-type POTRA domain-containing protein [Akkermansiaceae bacterium]
MIKLKRQTSKPRRRTRAQVLEVRVMSPRIAWFGLLKFLGRVTKLTCILAVVAGLGWGIWQGIERAFYQNPDFRLQVIDLNENPVIDVLGLAEAAGIDLTASLFDIDVDQVTEKLRALPEISAVRAERHLPGTLVVRVTAREPRGWVSCPQAGLPEGRHLGAMLVDVEGVAYPCPALQWEAAASLPVIQLPFSEDHPILAGQPITHPELIHCSRLLDSASEADPEAPHWIDSVKQVNEWSLLIITRDGTSATFGLGDHPRQIHNLVVAMNHSSQKGYAIETINLIPKHNVPVTLRDGIVAPRAIPVPEPTPGDVRVDRRARDLGNLLNRN